MTEIFNKEEKTDLRKLLRNSIPDPEVIMWSQLQQKRMRGYKFRRQASIDRYVVDFYCPREKLVIEIDGDSHFTDEAEQYDAERTKIFEALGLRVLRFTNEDVRQRLTVVLDTILEELSAA
ncbi:MAG: hypothetical protein COU11_04825 [Candidatus Harrisonbacteria bacterium CG10_big_fil_rev_8_21_14_0_10_49_15]|uniref:DUF559 domain-containing protein n=1 Tax=Candidatus Harrisonbacteria bacterium CG10_big_fil_rev_8_21_14_0_10_49_15 TaxID=1974587 RepID=A0A2H0UJP2_9BACT|nr:MAG: hypothetical protein COU11_04825 [Candidatus Harrisonbacteria bacterium CG10_big_fil_rev_8_21_14_0_10_49_15]